MHEIRATISSEQLEEALRLTRLAGIEEATTTDVFLHGPDVRRVQLCIETSTPKARAFTDALMSSERFSKDTLAITSREVRAIVNKMPVEDVTQPMSEPLPDVVQDLWQLSHVTLSYSGRAFAGGLILATGIIENNAIAIVVAALFLPFLAQVTAFGIGMWCRDHKLMYHGVKAVIVSITLAYLGGAVVALIEGGPIGYHGFKEPLSSFAISAIIGVTAGLSAADDSGRRYLIGVAAAVQLAIFPVWFGASSVLGLPSHDVLLQRITSFCINLVTIAGMSAAAYALANRSTQHRVDSKEA